MGVLFTTLRSLVPKIGRKLEASTVSLCTKSFNFLYTRLLLKKKYEYLNFQVSFYIFKTPHVFTSTRIDVLYYGATRAHAHEMILVQKMHRLPTGGSCCYDDRKTERIENRRIRRRPFSYLQCDGGLCVGPWGVRAAACKPPPCGHVFDVIFQPIHIIFVALKIRTTQNRWLRDNDFIFTTFIDSVNAICGTYPSRVQKFFCIQPCSTWPRVSIF